MAKSKKSAPKGNETAAAGRFGEAYIAHLLAKKGVDVVQANSSGFDLLAIDKGNHKLNSYGLRFRRGRLICISVKDRKLHTQIPIGYKKLDKAAKKWNADPWVGIVISNPPKLDAYLVPLDEARELSKYNKNKKDRYVSVSKIRDKKKYTLAQYAEESTDK
jgi:hypothetical protein